ncbi:hypothetical protein ACWIEX_24015 [Bosea sp. NPDC055353]
MAAVENVKSSASGEIVESSSLVGPRFAPLRGLLKLLVQADGSRSTLSRLRAAFTLFAALSAFAFLGYLLPTLLW